MEPRLHDPSDMVLFAKVVEHGSMSAAARALFRPKASVSRAIARLEASLDVLLLERSSRRLVLTPVGRIFLTHCQRVADDIAEAQAAVGDLQGALRGRLRVASSVLFGRVWLGPILPAFLAEHPQLRLELELTNRLVDPVEEGYDLVIRANAQTDHSLVVRRLAVATYGLFASQSYLDRHPPISSPKDLAGHLVIDTFHGADRLSWEFVRDDERVSVNVHPRLDVNDSLIRAESAAAGIGLTLIPNWIGDLEMGQACLVPVLPDWKPIRQAPLNALWPARRRSSPRLHAFLDFVSRAVTKSGEHGVGLGDDHLSLALPQVRNRFLL